MSRKRPRCTECGKILAADTTCPNEACSMSLLDPPDSRVRPTAPTVRYNGCPVTSPREPS